MDELKQGYRNLENQTKEVLRQSDGDESIADKVGNVADDVRDGLGNLGDKASETVDDLTDATGDGADDLGDRSPSRRRRRCQDGSRGRRPPLIITQPGRTGTMTGQHP